MFDVLKRRAIGGTAALAFLIAACGGNAGAPQSSGAGKTAEPTDPISMAMSSAVPQVGKIPAMQALEALKKGGREVKTTWYQSSEDPVQAVARGDANFGHASSSAVFAATAQGVPVISIMEIHHPDYAMAALATVKDGAGLSGLRVGIHAKVSTTALLTNILMKQFPTAKPNILVVPGSEARIQAMVAGQLDASVVQISDLAALDLLAPGKFHVVYDFAQKNPELIDSVYFTSKDVLAKNPTLVGQFLRGMLAAHRAAYTDVAGLAAAITANVPKTTPERGKELAKLYTDSKVWTTDGGMTTASVNATIKALDEAELLKKVPTPQQCCDRTVLDQVLK